MIFVGLKFEFAGGDAMAGCLYHTKQDRPAIFCSTGLAYVRDVVLLVFGIFDGSGADVVGCPAPSAFEMSVSSILVEVVHSG